MKPPAALTDIVSSLEPRLRETLSAITVEYREGEASATLSFALFVPSTRGVDETNLPQGITISGFERWPDCTRPLDETIALGEQIKALHASGIVGNLDAVRMDRGTKGVEAGFGRYVWHIKTHAGSQAERNEWLRQIRQ